MRFVALNWVGDALGRLAELSARPLPERRDPVWAPPHEMLADTCPQPSRKAPAKIRKTSGKRRGTKAKPLPPLSGADAVLGALITACLEAGPWRTLSVSELAAAMECSVGEASKRVKAATDGDRYAWAQRMGRRKMVGLHRLTSEQWQRIAASATPYEAVSLYRTYTRPRRPA